MKNTISHEIYDLIVIGNGIAAQAFLWNLSQEFQNANKSQNFSIAHVYSEKMTPACTLHSSATASLNGIEGDVSPLGNDLREAFFLFDDLYKTHRPEGIEEVTRTVVATQEDELRKIKRRYKTLSAVESKRIKGTHPGVEFNSYLIEAPLFLAWLEKNTSLKKEVYETFIKNIERDNDVYTLTLENKTQMRGRKILLATGAFSKIFDSFFKTSTPSEEESLENMEEKNTIKAGSYLEKDMDLGESSFFLTIDGHQVLYKANALKKLQLGSVTTIGAYGAPDLSALESLHEKISGLLNFEIGAFKDFKTITGLRHKGPRRLMIVQKDQGAELFRINGLYKNGFTLSFLAAKKMYSVLMDSSIDKNQ